MGRQKIVRVSVSSLFKKISSDPDYLKAFLTSSELRYCRSKKFLAESAAARLAAKKACLALLGVSVKDSKKWMRTIEIRKTALGQPVFKFSSSFAKAFPVLKRSRAFLSMAHERESAIAWVFLCAN